MQNLVIINPGSGPVDNATLEDAVKNIKQFVADCKEQSRVKNIRYRRHAALDEGGRYGFIVYNGKAKHQIEMPGLSIEKVRYISKDQNIWDFPRLYIDGSSWVWKFAILGRKEDWITKRE